MDECVINWLWSNSRRSEKNSGSWWQSEKNHHINVLELVTVSIEIKDFKLSNLCLLLETDETTRFAMNKWRSPCKYILNTLTLFRNCVFRGIGTKEHFEYKLASKWSCTSLSKSEANSRNVPESTDISIGATVGWAAGNKDDDITKKTGKRRNSSDYLTLQIMWSPASI